MEPGTALGVAIHDEYKSVIAYLVELDARVVGLVDERVGAPGLDGAAVHREPETRGQTHETPGQAGGSSGADDGTRTRDPHLGNTTVGLPPSISRYVLPAHGGWAFRPGSSHTSRSSQ